MSDLLTTLSEGTGWGGTPRDTWDLPWADMDQVETPTRSKLRMPVHPRALGYVHPVSSPGEEGGTLHCFGGADVPAKVLLAGNLRKIRREAMAGRRKTTAGIGTSCRSVWWWHTAHQDGKTFTAPLHWYPDNQTMLLAAQMGMDFIPWAQGLHVHYRRGQRRYRIVDGVGHMIERYVAPTLIRKRRNGKPALDHTQVKGAKLGGHMAYLDEVPEDDRHSWFMTYQGTMVVTYRGFDPDGGNITMSYGDYPHADEINMWEDGGAAWDFALTHHVGGKMLRPVVNTNVKVLDAPDMPPMHGGEPLAAVETDPSKPSEWRFVEG